MSAKHTPGPWCLDPLELGTIGDVCTLDGTPIAQAQMRQPMSSGKPDTERQANARLIAAAPDLLEELKNIANARPDTWEDPSEFEAWAKSRARFTIAKAEGAS